MIDSERLKAPFDPDTIKWRVGNMTKDKSKGLPLAYIDARQVQDRLDEVVGPLNWESSYHETASGRVICSLGIRDEGYFVCKSDGAGSTDYEAEKGGISDAFKRAAVAWGVGRYLYSIKAPWVNLDNGRIAADELGRLHNLLTARKEAEIILEGGEMIESPPKSDGESDKDYIYRRAREILTQFDFASKDALRDWVKTNRRSFAEMGEELYAEFIIECTEASKKFDEAL